MLNFIYLILMRFIIKYGRNGNRGNVSDVLLKFQKPTNQ